MIQATPEAEQYDEELVVKPLPSGHLLAHFHFTLSASASQHYVLFPSTISRLAEAVPFGELELALTRGRWHHHSWGEPLLPAKPVGAELRAGFPLHVPPAALPAMWRDLSHALSGAFCASLNELARPETTALHAIDAAPAGPHPSTLRWLSAALPSETVCTENLTPWLKLLPCRDADGLASLFVRSTLFGADYHSLGVHLKVERAAPGAPSSRLTLTQTLTLVLPPAAHRGVRRTVPLPGAYPTWDLAATFGAPLHAACPLASASRLYVQVPEQLLPRMDLLQVLRRGGRAAAATEAASAEAAPGDANGGDEAAALPEFTLVPAPDALLLLLHSGDSGAARRQPQQTPLQALHAYDLRALQALKGSASEGRPAHGLSVAQEWAEVGGGGARVALTRPRFDVRRFTTGSGQMHGGMMLTLRAVHVEGGGSSGSNGSNGSSDSSGSSAGAIEERWLRPQQQQQGLRGQLQAVCVFQSVPWYVRVWLHTLRLQVDGEDADLDAALLLRHVSPAADRAAPLVLDLCLCVPAAAQSVSLHMQFSKAFLTVFEIPPDPYRGFDVPAALVTYFPASGNQGFGACRAGGRATLGAGNSTWEAPSWQVAQAAGVAGAGSHAHAAALSRTPLLAALAAPRAARAYSDGLLVALAAPDVTMPYNVICLTSTVLAIYVGATLNTLLRRSSTDAAALAQRGDRSARRRKAAKVLAVLGAFGGLAVYLDEGLREEVGKALRALGLAEPAPPGGPQQLHH